MKYFPGQVNFERADVLLLNKCNTAEEAGIAEVEANAKRLNPKALTLRANSPVSVSDPAMIKGKRVLVVEDGPTLTHGEMKYGAGVVAAREAGAAELVDPRPWATGELKDTFEKYPGIGTLLPAMGYGEKQMKDLQDTINAVDCDLVLIGTPIDLARVIDIQKPTLRVTYDLADEGPEFLEAIEKAISARAAS